MLPEQAQGPGIALPCPADKVCFMFLLNNSPGSSEQPSVGHSNGQSSLSEATHQMSLDESIEAAQQPQSLLVFCQAHMQAERATSWMQGLLQVVQAQHVLVIASLPVSMPSCWYSNCMQPYISQFAVQVW